LNGLPAIAGEVNVGAHSRIQGFEYNNLHNISRAPHRRIDWTWGYRFLQLDEAIFFNVEQAEAAPPGQQFGTQRRIIDDFGTINSFHGFNLGLRSQWYAGNWTFDINGKLGFGANRNTVQVYGYTQTASPPQFQTVNSLGGLYALRSNIGNITEINFSFVPEIEVGIGYYFCERWRITLAYSFLAMTGVVRPGDQIDSCINTNILDGNAGTPAVPDRLHNSSAFWLSPLALGLEYRW
ncbi:MAG TPA: BBP7 family outer membrane beta-barrel protein, partial [Gemmatales bacterium]|nr:BBP7 family outer membrane beta-barrel protein [Gemmatales bacterium]